MEFSMSEKILYWDEMKLPESRALEEELAHEGPIVFEDESVTLHHANYQKDSRNISLQHASIKGKQVIEKSGSEIEIKNANPSDIMALHREICKALAHTMDDQGRENSRLK